MTEPGRYCGNCGQQVEPDQVCVRCGSTKVIVELGLSIEGRASVSANVQNIEPDLIRNLITAFEPTVISEPPQLDALIAIARMGGRWWAHIEDTEGRRSIEEHDELPALLRTSSFGLRRQSGAGCCGSSLT